MDYPSTSLVEETSLLSISNDRASNSIDHRGCAAVKSQTGCWRSAAFIIGVEVAERFAFYGIQGNLINYLTGPLGQSTVTAANNVNLWSGTASLLPLLGGLVADSFLGRYCTIIVATLVYILGLGLLTLSAVLPSISSFNCQVANGSYCLELQRVVFFLSLYLVAFGQGGHKPCVQAFGADQFDKEDQKELKARSSFFNWWYFAMIGGLLVTMPILNYIQDNLSWSLGFGIPCMTMVVSLVVFSLGTKTYRFSTHKNQSSPFQRMGKVFFLAIRHWGVETSAKIDVEREASDNMHPIRSQQFMFLNKASISPSDSMEEVAACSLHDVEEVKSVLGLVPIWLPCLPYAIVFAQTFTFMTKQAVTMEREILPGFSIPSASIHSFTSLSIVLFIPIYDRAVVPISKAFTGRSSGLTMLQRIGTGMCLSSVSTVISALVERRRLRVAQDSGLVDFPNATVPMSVWWLIPQYMLFGICDAFTLVGLQEFFYDQVPDELRSMGLALYLSIIGVGSYLSSVLVSVIDRTTGGNGQDSWFATNLNHGHLDYFYAVLAALSAIGLLFFFFSSKSYIYKRHTTLEM